MAQYAQPAPGATMQQGRQAAAARAAAPAALPPSSIAPAPQAAPPVAAEPIERDFTIAGVARNARQIARRSNGPITQQEAATPEEDAEYQRVTDALSRVLYEDDNTNAAVVESLKPEDKVGSLAQTAILLVKQLDEKLDMDEVVIPQLTMDIVDRLVDLGEQTKQIEFSDDDVKNALGAAWEGVLQMYGTGDAADFEELTQGMSDEELQGQTAAYKQFLGGDF